MGSDAHPLKNLDCVFLSVKNERSLVRRGRAGFTLIELLVVMLIVAMISSVVVLNLPPPRGEEKNEAEVFAARLDAASEMAVMTGAMFGLEVSEGGYRYYRYERGVWQNATDRRLALGAFPADIAVEFTLTDPAANNEAAEENPREKDKEAPAPSIFFTPTGETTPLTAKFVSRRGNISVSLDAAGNVTMEQP